MSKKKKKHAEQQAAQAKAAGQAATRFPVKAGKPLPPWATIGLALLAFYLMTLLIFPRNILQNYDFKISGDNLPAASTTRMGEDFARSGSVPGWCPYIFGGMPMVGSLLYANHYYPGFFLGKILSVVFFFSSYSWLFLHFLLAGLGIYLLLRELGVHWGFALICGICFAFNPTMAVYADVGHGSKLMTIAYLPWILFFTKRLFDHPHAGRAALLALAFGLQLLALHVQIAYYAAMMMGLYAVYSLIAGGKKDLFKNVRATLLLAATGVLAFGLASPLYLQIQEYSHYSIRGGGATGGASWDYATQWSFHPLESLTYLFPSFFGFGGQTYWGYLPGTDMPLYWGGVILLFAPWALYFRRDRMTIFLVLLAALAWIISFGKYLAVLYWPLYEFLPYFNKFRVPVLIQVLVLLPAVALAGISLQATWEAAGGKPERAQQIARKFLWAGLVLGALCLLLLAAQSGLQSTFFDWMKNVPAKVHGDPRYGLQGEAASIAYGMLTSDLLRLLFFVGLLYGAVVLVLWRKWPRWILPGIVVVVCCLELRYLSRDLVHPTPPQEMDAYQAADETVKYLQQEKEPYRILPLSAGHDDDWYMQHRIESLWGYSGAKMRLFQEAIDSLQFFTQTIGYLKNPNIRNYLYNQQIPDSAKMQAYFQYQGILNELIARHGNFLQLMNVRYLVNDLPIENQNYARVLAGQNAALYRNPNPLSRAYLVNQIIVPASEAEYFTFLRNPAFAFSQTALVEKPLTLDAGATGTVSWATRTPDRLALNVQSSGRQLLVLSEIYYPSGWKATLDGKEIPILRTDYLLRGVEIPAGNHKIEMHFVPPGAALGNMMKWISLVIIAASLAVSALWQVKAKLPLFKKAAPDGV